MTYDVEERWRRASPRVLTKLGMVCVQKQNANSTQDETPWAVFESGNVRIRVEFEGWYVVPYLSSTSGDEWFEITPIMEMLRDKWDYDWEKGLDEGLRVLARLTVKHWDTLQRLFGRGEYERTAVRVNEIVQRMREELRRRRMPEEGGE